MQFIKAVVYGNLWIATGAMSTAWLFEGLGVGRVTPAVLILIFSATFFRYNLIGFTVSSKVTSEKFLFAWKYRQWLKAGAVLGALGATACLPWLNIWQILLLSHLAILSLWYIFPLPFKLAPALRKLPFIKIFLIAYVWTVSAWLLPYTASTADWKNMKLWMSFAERFLFVFAITLPFDIRDIDSDNETQVKTIPNQLGPRLTKNIGAVLLLACGVLSYISYQPKHCLMLLCSYICAYLLLENSSSQKHDLYFLGWIDGTLILQALLIMLSRCL